MKIVQGKYPFDLAKCFAVKIDNGSYASVYEKDTELAISPELTPVLGDEVLIRYRTDGHCALAIYQSPTRFQIIGATNTETKEYPKGDVDVLGVIFEEVIRKRKKHWTG